jgi:choline dehydrogenase-like flavoprotein
MAKPFDFEFDQLVVGSGFGGSVAAMRLAQKGYSVGVVEAGLRWHADRFPRRNWNLRKFLWLPSLGLYGIWRMRLLSGNSFPITISPPACSAPSRTRSKRPRTS